MATTPNLGLPIPELTDSPNSPSQVSDLAIAIDDVFPAGAGAWASFVPTVAQGATADIAKTVNYCRWYRIARWVTYMGSLTVTAAGTSGSAITIDLPVSAAFAGDLPAGIGSVLDISVPLNKGAQAVLSSVDLMSFLALGVAGGYVGTSTGPSGSFALANNDRIVWAITYEAAS